MPAIYDTRPQDSVGTSTVDLIVQGEARHGWQVFDPRNDNGVDGMIIMRKNHKNKRIDTGELIFAQVKCGSPNGYYTETKKRPKHFGVNVGEAYIDSHKPKWQKLFGPVILIYVDYKTKNAWWTDLKDENSYTKDNKSLILVPKQQRFGIHSFGEFKRLKGYLHISPEIQMLPLERTDINLFKPSQKLKESARQYYRTWAVSQDRTNPELGEIIVSREGWRHICRKGRKTERIIQSWSLLGVARKVIQEVRNVYQLRVEISTPDALGNYSQIDYISLRAQVIFPQRHSSIVQVVLKRRRKFDSVNGLLESKIWFHSVYEPMAQKVIR
ncbi:DUF4365 domain-containing protein [Mucilaginibacter sp. UC70_90]